MKTKTAFCAEYREPMVPQEGEIRYGYVWRPVSSREYFTPEEYERVVGEDYPDQGPVWYRLTKDEKEKWEKALEKIGGDCRVKNVWRLTYWKCCKGHTDFYVVCAIGNPNPPPKNWRR